MNKFFAFVLITLFLAGCQSQKIKDTHFDKTNASDAIKQEVEYKKALPPYQYHFPKDHASHPQYKTEWWYYTGNLKTESGKDFGYELTFFRVGSGLKPRYNSLWDVKDFYMTHFAVSDISENRFKAIEKLNRAGVSTAGSRSDQYQVWNENWRVDYEPNAQIHKLYAADGDYKLSLNLKNIKVPVIHGKNGVSQKADCIGCASHYYSLTHLVTNGEIEVNGTKEKITGLSWMDHEFGSNQLSKTQVGWDWFSIQLDNKTELMLYLLRHKDGTLDKNSSGTLVYSNGQSKHLRLNEFKINVLDYWVSSKTKGRYPSRWQIELPSENIKLLVEPKMLDQELVFTPQGQNIAYWEGACRVSGQFLSKPTKGHAYVELTGYSDDFKTKI